MSPKLKCHKIWNIIRTEVLPKLNCHQNWSVIKTEMLPKLKCYQNWNVMKHINVLNKKLRDRHWIPWSCLFFVLSFITISVFSFNFAKVRVWVFLHFRVFNYVTRVSPFLVFELWHFEFYNISSCHTQFLSFQILSFWILSYLCFWVLSHFYILSFVTLSL